MCSRIPDELDEFRHQSEDGDIHRENPTRRVPLDRWSAPSKVTLAQGRLTFSSESRSVSPGEDSDVLGDFLRLSTGTDLDVLRFAKKWGRLGLCAQHGKFVFHADGYREPVASGLSAHVDGAFAREAGNPWQSMDRKELFKWVMGIVGSFPFKCYRTECENVSDWVRISSEFRNLMRIARYLHEDTIAPEDLWSSLNYAISPGRGAVRNLRDPDEPPRFEWLPKAKAIKEQRHSFCERLNKVAHDAGLRLAADWETSERPRLTLSGYGPTHLGIFLSHQLTLQGLLKGGIWFCEDCGEMFIPTKSSSRNRFCEKHQNARFKAVHRVSGKRSRGK